MDSKRKIYGFSFIIFFYETVVMAFYCDNWNLGYIEFLKLMFSFNAKLFLFKVPDILCDSFKRDEWIRIVNHKGFWYNTWINGGSTSRNINPIWLKIVYNVFWNFKGIMIHCFKRDWLSNIHCLSFNYIWHNFSKLHPMWIYFAMIIFMKTIKLYPLEQGYDNKSVIIDQEDDTFTSCWVLHLMWMEYLGSKI